MEEDRYRFALTTYLVGVVVGLCIGLLFGAVLVEVFVRP